MAYSTCPKCTNSRFEIVENEPTGSNFKLMFVQCNSCGAVVGVTDYYNVGALLQEIKKHLGIPLQ